jgi:N utilization substance protein B
MTRREARELALSTLYQLDLRQNLNRSNVSVYDRDINEVDLEEESFCYFLVDGTLNNKTAFDLLINKVATRWPIDQIPYIEKNIIRIALFEIQYTETPVKIAINEALELAKLFGGDNASKFVHGVLGEILKKTDQLKV